MVCTMLTQTPLVSPASVARPSASPYSFRGLSTRRAIVVRAEKGPLDQLEEKAQVRRGLAESRAGFRGCHFGEHRTAAILLLPD